MSDKTERAKGFTVSDYRQAVKDGRSGNCRCDSPSFLGATAVLFVMQRFFPEVKAGILGFAGLPAATPNAVFILVLLVVGVAVQAAWWMIRHRQFTLPEHARIGSKCHRS